MMSHAGVRACGDRTYAEANVSAGEYAHAGGSRRVGALSL